MCCRGESFRKVLLRIKEIRSIIPESVYMMCLTATARWGIFHGMERNGTKSTELFRYKSRNGTQTICHVTRCIPHQQVEQVCFPRGQVKAD